MQFCDEWHHGDKTGRAAVLWMLGALPQLLKRNAVGWVPAPQIEAAGWALLENFHPRNTRNALRHPFSFFATAGGRHSAGWHGRICSSLD